MFSTCVSVLVQIICSWMLGFTFSVMFLAVDWNRVQILTNPEMMHFEFMTKIVMTLFNCTLLYGWWTLCSPNHFAPWNTLHLNTFYLTHFAPQHALHLSTLWSSAHFNHRSTLLPGILCFLEHLTPWNTLLPGTLCFKRSREQRMLRRTI